MIETTARERFAEIARGPEESIDLAEAALLIAAEAYPGLDVAAYVGRLDALAERARPLLHDTRDARTRVARLNDFLFVRERFTGNRDQYYDPRNSFLNEVLDRRTGIPITLTLVYTEVGRRLALPVHGVGFPGHFLAAYGRRPDVIIDPFFGKVLTPAECEERLRRTLGPRARLTADHLRPATPKQILARVLGNLKFIEMNARRFESALSYSDRILLLDPANAGELRDRGLVYARLECYGAAQADLERFLDLAPRDPTAEAVRTRLIEVRRKAARIH